MRPGNPRREGGKKGGRGDGWEGGGRTDGMGRLMGGSEGCDGNNCIMKWVHMACNGFIIGNTSEAG